MAEGLRSNFQVTIFRQSVRGHLLNGRIGLARLEWSFLPHRTAPKQVTAASSSMERIRVNEATHFVGRLCGCNDSSHMAPAFRPSSTIKRAISACAGGFASIVLQLTSVNTCRRPCPCDSEGVYRHDIVVRDSPWALFGPGVGLAQDLSVEQMPVMDMQLADKAESAAH